MSLLSPVINGIGFTDNLNPHSEENLSEFSDNTDQFAVSFFYRLSLFLKDECSFSSDRMYRTIKWVRKKIDTPLTRFDRIVGLVIFPILLLLQISLYIPSLLIKGSSLAMRVFVSKSHSKTL